MMQMKKKIESCFFFRIKAYTDPEKEIGVENYEMSSLITITRVVQLHTELGMVSVYQVQYINLYGFLIVLAYSWVTCRIKP